MSTKKAEAKPEKIVYRAPACYGCVVWARFGDKCHYFWDEKKECSMWAGDWESVTKPA